MNDDREHRILAMRVADLPMPHVPSRPDTCVVCGEPVWVSLRTEAKCPAICWSCIPQDAKVVRDSGVMRELLDLGYSDAVIQRFEKTAIRLIRRPKH